MPEVGQIKKARELGYAGYTKYIWHCCPDCGREYWIALFNKYRRSGLCLSCSRKGIRNPNYGKGLYAAQCSSWKGGRQKSGDYVRICLAPNDFFYPMVDHHNTVYEHRLVMAKHLKRCLLPWEIVHHKNGKTDDNRLENLELLPSRKYHLVDHVTKGHITRLMRQVALLKAENNLLKQQLDCQSCKAYS